MAEEEVLQQHHVQWFEDFASKLEKLTIFTIIFIPNYTLFCVLSFFLSTAIYRSCYRFHIKYGLKQSDKEYYEGMFWAERLGMFFLAMRDYNSWGFLLWTLALASFGCSYVLDLSKSNKLGHLSQKVLMRTTINNDPRLNPGLQQGYIFWLQRVIVIIVAAIPFNHLVDHYYYSAFGLLLAPAIMSYVFKPENNTSLNLNSKDNSKDVVKKNENKEVDSEIKYYNSLQKNHLFWLERVAILSSILFSAKRELLMMVSSAFHLVCLFARHDVDPSNQIDLDLLFWIERAATFFLSAYGSNESSFHWYMAVILFAITNTVYFINPIQHMLELMSDCMMFEDIENEFEETEEDRLEKLEVEIKELKSENNELNIEISLWDQQLETVYSELTREEDNHSRERSLWAQELEREKADNDDLKADNNDLKRDNDDLKRDNDDLKRERSDLVQELGRANEENEKLKTLMRERKENHLKEKSMWAQQLQRITEHMEEHKKMVSEREDMLVQEHTELLKRQMRERGDTKDHHRDHQRSLLAQELERMVEENEENKRLMREREDIWDKRFDKAISEHNAEKRALFQNYQTLIGETLLGKTLIGEGKDLKALGKDKEDKNLLETLTGQECKMSVEDEGVTWHEEKSELVGATDSDSLENYERLVREEERGRLEEERAEKKLYQDRIIAVEGIVVELSEEVKRLKGQCELYRGLLHDQDFNPMQEYDAHNHFDSPYYYPYRYYRNYYC